MQVNSKSILMRIGKEMLLSKHKEINLELVSSSEILEKKWKFFKRHYKREYRWTRQQVEQLLDDIDAFIPREV